MRRPSTTLTTLRVFDIQPATLPDCEFFRDYMHYTSENEADPKLHRWAGLFTLAATLSRRVFIRQGDWEIYPNLYAFFVGAPASGKSVALEMARKLILSTTEIEVAPDQITREALTLHMDKKCQRKYTLPVINDAGQVSLDEIAYTPITIFSDELVILLGAEPMRMIDFLTAVYSNPTHYKVVTKNMGSDSLTRPCLSLLGNLTPSTMSSMLTQNLITGGFARRITFIYAPGRGKPKHRPVMTDTHYAAKARCAAYLRQLATLTGEFQLTQPAWDLFADWYYEVKDKNMRAALDDVMSQYWSALDVSVLKVALLFSAAESLNKVVDIRHVRLAINWLHDITSDVKTVLGGGGRNDLAPVIHAVAQAIRDEYARSTKPVNRKWLLLKFRSQAKDEELAVVLRHLVETDEIVATQVPSGLGTQFLYQPAT